MHVIRLIALCLTFMLIAHVSEPFRCGTPFLKQGARLPPYDTAVAPGALPRAPQRSIGSQRTFFAIDFAKQQQYTLQATLRARGAHCYIYVEDTAWQENVHPLTPVGIQRALEGSTPADVHRGIYDILTAAFGVPPDVDNTEKIIVLLLNIRDISHAYTTAGYFMPLDQLRGTHHHPTLGPLHSNGADMLYLNAAHAPDTLHATLAHELLHLIHWQYSPNETIWVDEGCAEYAAFLCGYTPIQQLAAFQGAPHISLTAWPDVSRIHLLAHYGAAFLFMHYLHDHYGGTQTVTAIVKGRLDGIAGITHALAVQGAPHKNFSDIFADWKVANYLTAWRSLGALEKKYTYSIPVPPIPATVRHRGYPVTVQGGTLVNFAAHGIDFQVESDTQRAGLALRFAVAPRVPIDIKIATLRDSGAIRVETVPIDIASGTASIDIPQFSTAVQRVMLLPSLQVSNTSVSQRTADYSYDAVYGNRDTYTCHVLPNPVHVQYWDILVVPRTITTAQTFTITLTAQNRVLHDAQPMVYLHNTQRAYYRYTFHLPPDVRTTPIAWRVMHGDILIDAGTYLAQ